MAYNAGMYLQVNEAATALKVSRQWVHHLVTTNKLTTATLYGKRLIVMDDRFKAVQKARKDA